MASVEHQRPHEASPRPHKRARTDDDHHKDPTDDHDDEDDNDDEIPWGDTIGAVKACIASDAVARWIMRSVDNTAGRLSVPTTMGCRGPCGMATTEDGLSWLADAAAALRPPPAESVGLLAVSAILRDRPFTASYDDLIAGVPQYVLEMVAWDAPRIVMGFCVHPAGCGPIAALASGHPSHPHASRAIRVPSRIQTASGEPTIFTVADVVGLIARFYGTPIRGRMLGMVKRRLGVWYAQHAQWRPEDAYESIESFVERHLLARRRTGCTADDLTAERLRPCDWLGGHGGPTAVPFEEAAAKAEADAEAKGKERRRPEDDEDIADPGAERGEEGVKATAAATAAPVALRCVYGRLACRQPTDGHALIVYVQSRLCAVEDRL